jgi:hypothetical protein
MTLTTRQIRFAELRVRDPDTPAAVHYRQLYPARHGTRARQTEWNGAYRLAHNRKVAAYMEELSATEPRQIKKDALVRLYRIGRGELPREQELFARRQLREANRELRAREKVNPRRAAWTLFWNAQQSVLRGLQLSPAERTKLIFALYQPAPPPGQPMLSAEALAAELVAEEEQERDRRELVEFVRERQRDMGLDPFGRPDPGPPAGPAALLAPPEPAGHWRYEQISGRFGKGARRRVWVAEEDENV